MFGCLDHCATQAQSCLLFKFPPHTARMSGKAPPKGPRALLGTHGGPSAPSSASSSSLVSTASNSHLPPQHALHSRGAPTPSVSSVPINPGSRIGATPPTGPRSLGFQSSHARMPLPGPKHPFVNGAHPPSNSGMGSHGLQKNRHPISIKGKNRENINVGVC